MLLTCHLQVYLRVVLYQTNNLSEILQNDTYRFLYFATTLLLPIFNFFLLYDIITRKFSFRNHQEDLHLGVVNSHY